MFLKQTHSLTRIHARAGWSYLRFFQVRGDYSVRGDASEVRTLHPILHSPHVLIMRRRHGCTGVFCRVIFRLGAAVTRAGAAAVGPRASHALLLHASCSHFPAARTQPLCRRTFARCSASTSGNGLEAAGCQRVASTAVQATGVAGAEVAHDALLLPSCHVVAAAHGLFLCFSTYMDGSSAAPDNAAELTNSKIAENEL